MVSGLPTLANGIYLIFGHREHILHDAGFEVVSMKINDARIIEAKVKEP